MYEPWHTRLSLPPSGPNLATSNISPNNKVSTQYNVQCSEIELFSSVGWQIWQIGKAVHLLTSSSEWRQERFRGRTSPSSGSIAQLMIQIATCGTENTRKAHFKQRRQREMYRGLCGEGNSSGNKASSRCRHSDCSRAERYDNCWKCRGTTRKPERTIEEMLNAISDSLNHFATADDK